MKRQQPHPLDYACTTQYQHDRNPVRHAENTGAYGWACPVHSVHPIRFNRSYGYWETVTEPRQLRAGVDWTKVYLHSERIEEPVSTAGAGVSRTWGVFARDLGPKRTPWDYRQVQQFYTVVIVLVCAATVIGFDAWLWIST